MTFDVSLFLIIIISSSIIKARSMRERERESLITLQVFKYFRFQAMRYEVQSNQFEECLEKLHKIIFIIADEQTGRSITFIKSMRSPIKHARVHSQKNSSASDDDRIKNEQNMLSTTELSYLLFLQKNEVKHPKCTIAYFRDKRSKELYRGLKATATIAKGEIVCEVPDHECLLAERTSSCSEIVRKMNVRGCQGVRKGKDERGICAHEQLMKMNDDEEAEEMDNGEPRLQREALILAVACELAIGSKSKYYEYLRTMPRLGKNSTSLLSWTEEQKERLRGTDCWKRYKSYADEESKETPSMTNMHYVEVAIPFFEAVASGKYRGDQKSSVELSKVIAQLLKKSEAQNVELAFSDDDEEADDEDNKSLARIYRNAVNIVSSYSFTLGEGETETQALVPLWDMLNHEHPALASVRLSHDASTNSLNMIAVCDIQKGEEIYNTYGPLSDGELLRRYAFLPNTRNPHNSTTISFKELFAACDKIYGFRNPKVLQKKIFKITNETQMSRYAIHPNGRPSRKLLAMAHAIFSVEEEEEEDIEFMKTLTDEQKEQFDDEKKMQRATEITEALKYVCNRALHTEHRYPTGFREAHKTIQTLTDMDSRAKTTDDMFMKNFIDRKRVKIALRIRLTELKCFKMLLKWLRFGPSRLQKFI